MLNKELNRMFELLREDVDPLVTYEEACAITGKTMNALCSKISRSNIKPIVYQRFLRYSDVIKIRDKMV
jgi:hypothetical protein